MNLAKFIVFVCLMRLSQCADSGKRIPYFAGPYRIIFKRMTNESDITSSGKIWSKFNFTPAKPGQRQYRWGYTHMETDFTDEFKVDLELSVWANNQWKKNAFIAKFDHGCSDLIKHAKSLAKLWLGYESMVCPIKSGPKVLKNETFDITFPSILVFPYGRYRVTGIAGRKGAEIAVVIVALIDVVPRL